MKMASKPATAAKKRLRVHVSIDADVRRCLGAYAGAYSVTESQVIEDALRDRLRGFYFGETDVLPIRTTG
jgi:hypothetical protein